MGAIAAEAKEQTFWTRITDNPPDSQTRVRFLLDEIALLQSRFEIKDHYESKLDRDQRKSSGDGLESKLGEQIVLVPPQIDQVKDDAAVAAPALVDEQRESQEEIENQECEDILVQALEEKARTLLEERAWFFEKAEKELRIGKVEQSDLATLLQLEKAKLQRHRSELVALGKKIVYSTVGAAELAQDIVGKLENLLNERQSLHLKFEVQVELGHFFRLLKLLELQKAKHDISRKAIENSVQEFKAQVEQARSQRQAGAPGTRLEISEQTPEKDGGSEPTEALKETILDFPEDSKASSSSSTDATHSDGNKEKWWKLKKETKSEVLKLVATQEQRWKTQQAVLKEMERRLEVTELESQRLRNRLEEADCGGGCRTETETFSWTASLPQGYSSIYFSPIFQERKPSMKPPKDEKDAEIFILKTEIGELKSRLNQKQGEDDKFLDRIQVPSEEKTISIDATSNKAELNKRLFKVFGGFQTDVSRLSSSEDDKHSSIDFGEDLSKNSSVAPSQNDDLEAEIQAMKAKRSRAADEHSQQLDIKEKTLAYAQELNMRLANDMSTAENALAELRAEHTGLRASFEAKWKSSRNEAEELAKGLRMNIKALEKELADKDCLLSDWKSRVEACQKETDAAVFEKNEVLTRLQRVMSEMESQSVKITKLEARELYQEQLSSELQAARNKLNIEAVEHEALGQRYSQLQSRLLETEYQLSQREEALERLTLHLAASAIQEQRQRLEESSRESLRSKHRKKERARKSILEAEEKIASMVAEMSRAKLEMEELKSQSFQLLSTRTGKYY
ncbi:hypothetical protein SELMODRAFT_415152 [Selaginella moellendorffii]|uniref:Uncharacterized protein n=1 Tax=Selaginella moellendorffii TaxID=88036 RepID=D8RV69_SELML|nr:putative leucine-rich repeat-containing protein DDB_G0290503 [Selaginella moellendorffii]EFJ23722.1 hypothetical protein SELMODRAFT_415152 [Selaginella moellendorffii]|eukprot:XP_002974937.1 putative leucine-rich repeat-containing protein DDB_G0290503 [Selaginella moellendorffii]